MEVTTSSPMKATAGARSATKILTTLTAGVAGRSGKMAVSGGGNEAASDRRRGGINFRQEVLGSGVPQGRMGSLKTGDRKPAATEAKTLWSPR
ncbi:unnamed protein product [Linum trigynum]|uniref:Uncharacterized protein n=1 Tax=Linum trigynum TaxID=586398 RepID=A0AAV2G5F5_9ROSI